MNDMQVLIVDDEPQTRRVMRTALIAHGFAVTDARSGEEALESLYAAAPDVILLDLRMPGIGGIAACRAIRAHAEVPIIVVSMRQSEREKVEAFDAGADDFVTKPFGIEELVARIHAMKRRFGSPKSRILTLKDIQIDLQSHEVKRGDVTLHLTGKEFKLLDYLISHAGEVILHRRLLQAVWGPDYGDEIEYLRVFINHLRRKIEPDPTHPKYILTEPSTGYRFVYD